MLPIAAWQRLGFRRIALSRPCRLAFPDPFVAMPRAARDLRRGFNLDPPAAQSLGEGFAPTAQVFLARVQALAVTALRTLKCTWGLA